MEQELSGAEAGGIIALLGSMLLIIGAIGLILTIGFFIDSIQKLETNKK